MVVSAQVVERSEAESCTGASQAPYGIYQASKPTLAGFLPSTFVGISDSRNAES